MYENIYLWKGINQLTKEFQTGPAYMKGTKAQFRVKKKKSIKYVIIWHDCEYNLQ